ncbi:hypothetical protein KBD69_02620 [Candidatus Woesebacteria bacterium]|nr:hypothetical protein [Candidatus Woesebacteria bacterium]
MKDMMLQNTLQGLNIITSLQSGDEITILNIICPGYMRKREGSVEQFDFPALSDRIDKSPNVRLMIDKMYRYLSGISHLGNVKATMILADVAILNYHELVKKQDVQIIMDNFFNDINEKIVKKNKIVVDFVKMSELKEEFNNIPIDGVRNSEARLNFAKVLPDIKARASEYRDSLIFQRINKAMSENTFSESEIGQYSNLAEREVARFAVEYGFAGQAIKKLYTNPVILFTEPSGYLRGYFYHSYLKRDERMSVLYTI